MQAFAASDIVIWLSYMVLSVLFAGILRRRHNRSVWPVFWLLGVFVFSCGMTHVMGVVTATHACYRQAAAVNILCVAISLLAAIVTTVYMPHVMRVPPVQSLFMEFSDLKELITKELNEIADMPESNGARERLIELRNRLKK